MLCAVCSEPGNRSDSTTSLSCAAPRTTSAASQNSLLKILASAEHYSGHTRCCPHPAHTRRQKASSALCDSTWLHHAAMITLFC
jgi:hypothetical protein